MSKKIYFVCAPIFLYWPVEIVKKMKKDYEGQIISGGFIGGPKKYHEILIEEFGDLADNVVYTHDLEFDWITTEYSKEDLDFFVKLLGNDVLNQLIIADRHIGHGYLSGGDIASSQFLKTLNQNKKAYLNYIVGMLRYLYDFLSKNKPDLIYSYAVAGSFTLAIAELSKSLGITFTKLTHTRISDKIVIDTSPRDEMDIVKRKFLEPLSNYSGESLEFAEKYLTDFREKQEQPDYQLLQNNIYKSKTKFKYQLKLIAKYVKGNINRNNEFFHMSYLGNVDYEKKIVKGIKKFWKQKPFFEKDILKQPFLYYPLHVDPEASTMVISPYQTNQLTVVEAVAKAKPVDHILVIKEHLTMIGRRPKGFYEKINSMPGVYMINPLESSFPLIKDSSAVITLTGTSGLEAILLGKPAIFLGSFIYKFIGAGYALTNDLSALPKILNNLNEISYANDDVIIKLIAAIEEVSFSFNGGLIWSGVSKERVQKNPDVVDLFAQELKKYI